MVKKGSEKEPGSSPSPATWSNGRLLRWAFLTILSSISIYSGLHTATPYWNAGLRYVESGAKFLQNDSNGGFRCEKPNYTARILMYDPFMMHIENFITPQEAEKILAVGGGSLQPSRVVTDNGTEVLGEERTSRTAFLDRKEPVMECIMKRAAEIQGYIDIEDMEDLQITAYSKDQKYSPHFDWFEPHSLGPGELNRASTFFATLKADCTNCGTRFPEIKVNWTAEDPQWCKFVDCNAEAVTAHAVPGSAIFWRNLDSMGEGHDFTLHEGLPVPEGDKFGLNIWTKGR